MSEANLLGVAGYSLIILLIGFNVIVICRTSLQWKRKSDSERYHDYLERAKKASREGPSYRGIIFSVLTLLFLLALTLALRITAAHLYLVIFAGLLSALQAFLTYRRNRWVLAEDQRLKKESY
jgi:uncharacterized membrane protein YidH (DUF202 family)